MNETIQTVTATRGKSVVTFEFDYERATATVRGPGGSDRADLDTGMIFLRHLRSRGWECA